MELRVGSSRSYFINLLILGPIMCANGDGVKQDGRWIAGDPAVHPISSIPAHIPQHLEQPHSGTDRKGPARLSKEVSTAGSAVVAASESL